VTQNSGGPATLSGCSRGLSPISPYTASTTLAFSHAGGSQVIFSDPPQLFNLYTAKANDETIQGLWTFNNFPLYKDGTLATSSLQFITKGYADSLVAQGVATSTESIFGGVYLGTQLEMASSTFDAGMPTVLYT
jgi:hypothetical protein